MYSECNGAVGLLNSAAAEWSFPFIREASTHLSVIHLDSAELWF